MILDAKGTRPGCGSWPKTTTNLRWPVSNRRNGGCCIRSARDYVVKYAHCLEPSKTSADRIQSARIRRIEQAWYPRPAHNKLTFLPASTCTNRHPIERSGGKRPQERFCSGGYASN